MPKRGPEWGPVLAQGQFYVYPAIPRKNIFMDISNLIFWLKNGEPAGKNKNKLFDDEANKYFCSYVEKIGKSSHLWIEVEKK